jgi:hypothetical protein
MENNKSLAKHTQLLQNDIWLVPCKLDSDTKKFTPLVTADSAYPKSARKWLDVEDQIILQVIDKRG